MSSDAVQIALAGISLSDDEARGLEASLSVNPGDVDSRLKLLGYLCQRQFVDAALSQVRSEHVIWFIEHAPDNEIVGKPFCLVFPHDPSYARVCQVWDRILEKPDVRPEILLNASHFFVLDRERARALLERGEQLEPSWPDWAERLGENLFGQVNTARNFEDRGLTPKVTPEALREIALRALTHFERALALARTVQRRFQILPKCAEAALEGARLQDAVRYADETIAVARECPGDRHPSDRIHEAHIVRGRAALEGGDVKAACRELDAAGRQGSSRAPVHRPDFSLARLLLARGERNAVLSYLDRCATFWMPKRIAKWRSEIERGGRPSMFTGYDPNETE